jgi:hypothetical protein
LPSIIEDKCPISTPVILLMDNINKYRGRKRHFRLSKSVAPICGMTEKETVTMPQSDISSIKVKDLFLGMYM